MAKITGPLFSRKARGKLKELVFSSWKGRDYVRSKGTFHDKKSKKQLALRRIFKEAVFKWRALSKDEKKKYNERADALGLSGYNLFVREYMKNARPG